MAHVEATPQGSLCPLFQEHWIRAEDIDTLSPMHPNSMQGVDDMIRLGDLSEADMVHNLLIRYQQHKIYVSPRFHPLLRGLGPCALTSWLGKKKKTGTRGLDPGTPGSVPTHPSPPPPPLCEVHKELNAFPWHHNTLQSQKADRQHASTVPSTQ